VENSAGFLEQNKLDGNIKANIAFGGEMSERTVIIRNEIKNCRNEGIFAIECPFSWIVNNNITENTDGIITVDANPKIMGNLIRDQKRAGIILSGHSNPKVIDNVISDNYTCGIFFRESSLGYVRRNTLANNYYQISIEGLTKLKLDPIINGNNMVGHNDISTSFCNIF